ncbi:glutaminyl-tRNA synthase (glutamine-hydrolyzing) subunit B [Candidatus Peregrinibacteria bacterium CG1_02_41_10]|nr:MAG: glutaminyl-tRNA synthase (glutamine-hydrolyzing) subunit B [Candidatus Peregrinibacteria bacterium CG1_02_41_10]
MILESVIGLEIHARLNTRSKMFCACDNVIFDQAPNTQVCPICLGFPGMLPVVNQEAVKLGVLTALALSCEILEECKFDRKNYFYPDLPKGYQISQYKQPLSKKGYLEIKNQRFGITRVHLEEDAGKLIHTQEASLVDFNRSGTPLMEIVTEPDFRSVEDVVVFLKELQKILRCLGSSQAEMEKGMLRVDASISLRPQGETKLYPRSEIKNLNSFRAVQKALNFEIKRQQKLWEEGKPQSAQVSLLWDADKEETQFMRAKEEENDYRYFPEPDLPPLKIEKDFIEKLKQNLPELPLVKQKHYIETFGLSNEVAGIMTSNPTLSALFETTGKICRNYKKTANWIGSVVLGLYDNFADLKFIAADLAEVIQLVEENKLSNLNGKKVVELMQATGLKPNVIIEKYNLAQKDNAGELEQICQKIIQANSEQVARYRAGKETLLGFFIGQAMRGVGNNLDPKKVKETLERLLNFKP